ncbi:HlyD family secretion protein [Legionella erythra]|uniref:Hemolysin D n=1 Tax=Legionella erythra TaxID=448 RepID=A0A0W0TQ69_LEGER|nr:HlyD family efflux transporter periplasmic adaptor subunit [Legionella erythra]KTC97710.1 hemolysin D [Legionella erythra]
MTIKHHIALLLILLLQSCGHSGERSYQGYVEGENIYLASPNSGILEKLLVKRGQTVTKGQLIFQLDSEPQAQVIKQYASDLEQAKSLLLDLKNPRRAPEVEAIEAQIEQVDAQIKLTEIRVKRYQSLYEKNAIEKDRLDEILATYDQQKKLKDQYQANLTLAKMGSRSEQIKAQEAQIQAITAKLNEAKWQLAQKTVYSPAAGVIFDTYYRPGEFVGAQQAVASLLTPENVHIEFYVPVQELAHLSVGKAVSFTCSGCQPDNTAVISYIAPEAEYAPPLVYSRENDDKLVFRIQARFDHFHAFKPGQPVTVLVR